MRTAVFYATREGQSELVAQRVAGDLRSRAIEADVIDVKGIRGHVDWDAYDAAFVVASVHVGRHEREMIEFVKRSRRELEALNAAFVSLTLSQAGAELDTNTPAQREKAHAEALRMVADFAKDTGWRFEHSLTVAGALMYSKYNFLVKWVMKLIAHAEGFDGPTSSDYEFTNWSTVDRFVDEVGGR